MTRAEHHADSPAHQVRQSRARVRHALESHAVGRDNALSGVALADQTPLKPTTVRDIIAELRDEPDGPPIGNCADGYYIISDVNELEQHISDVKDEIATKQERLEATVEAFNKHS